MKKILLGWLVVALSLTSILHAAESTKLRIGIDGAYPPFGQVGTNGQLQGFDVDIAKVLCEEIKAQCTLISQDFDAMIPSLQSRKLDAIVASMSITEERKKAVDFTDKYYQSPNYFIAKAGTALVVTPAGLKGKRIGVQRTTVHDRFVTDVFKDSAIVRYTKQDEVYLDLAAGRIDCALLDAAAAGAGFLNTPAGKGFTFTGPSFSDPKYFGAGIGIAVRKNDNTLRDKLNTAIKTIRSNGTYQKIQDKYFNFDIYSGAVAIPAKK